MGEDVLFGPRVAVADVLQRDFVPLPVVLRERIAFSEVEGLRPVEELPDGGDVQALPVEGGEFAEDAGDPLGKAADRPEVEEEFRRGQPLGEGQPEEVGVGDAVPAEGEDQVDDVGPEVDLLLLFDKPAVKGGGFVPDRLQPVPQAEDADVLGKIPAGLGPPQVAHLLPVGGVLLPVLIPPAVQLAVDEKTDSRRQDDDCEQQRVQPRQQRQVDEEAEDVV